MFNNLFTFRLSYLTRKSGNEITSSLVERIKWKSDLTHFSDRESCAFKEFEGYTTDNNTFIIRRILKVGANSFIPLIRGEVKETQQGQDNILMVQASLQKGPKIILIIINMFMTILLGVAFVSGNIFNLVSLSFVLVISLSWLSTSLLLKLEVKKADEFLKRLV